MLIMNVFLQEIKCRQGPVVMGGDPEVTSKLSQLETEVSLKKQEIIELREQVNNTTCYCIRTSVL